MVTLGQLVDEYGASDVPVLALPFPWTHPPLFFAFSPAEEAFFDELHRRCLHFSPDVFTHAMEMAQAPPLPPPSPPH